MRHPPPHPWPVACALLIAAATSAPAADKPESTPQRALTVPAMTEGAPAAGRRVRHTLPAYKDTQVYHTLYLPTDWKPGGKFPVIIEYAGNRYGPDKHGDVCTGAPEGCKLGYGQSGGKGFIWVCLPYVNAKEKRNQLTWWGDVDATVAYCVDAVRMVCRDYGGDSDAVLLTGFSRGAIACGYIGLHNDEIASLWRGFMPHSHFDGVRKWGYPGSDAESARKRLARLRGRPMLISHESPKASTGFLKATSLDKTRRFLEGVDGKFSFLPIDTPRHTDTWVLEDRPERRKLRRWLADVLAETAANTHPTSPPGP